MKITEVSKKVIDVIKEFPTNTDRLLATDSYFYVVYSHLVKVNSFLEIGYRKGLFVEVSKALSIPSVHVDISDELLRAVPTENNVCYTNDSLSFLKECDDSFDLIFQDGSKDLKVRKKEYDIIMKRKILSEGGVIVVDDLHYPDCMEAYKYAIDRYGFSSKEVNVKDKNPYKMGILTWKE